MKRGLLISSLLIALGVAVGALAFCLAHHRDASGAGWLQKEFGLDAAQVRKVSAIQQDYEATCAEMCERIASTDRRLAEAIRTSRGVTPEIRAALAETDAVRTECRAAMLAHFYQVAEELPADQRARYLDAVLPTVLHPGEMAMQHRH